MGIFTFTDELTSPVAPARIFRASIVDSHNLIPKLLPHAVKSIELLKGDGGAGSVKQINFAEGSKIRYLKHHIDDLNEENYVYNYTLIEGEGMMDKIDKISYEVKFEASCTGGTISKMTTKVYAKDNFQLKDEEINAGKEKVMGMYKIVEAYLLQNPDAYV
ncbi:Major allergen Pru ar 1 [Heracleum sosnowskyi]|uniref:Major allergen Pru ar 1 n=1 Tax=Heracleum sosnowskyi TaxID=360622 RepID=A0AAD8JEW0_9APIA|nr:Major allergen Pru ar 1 [Heracleum sosnowskyi]